jgi:peptide/nickel transport system ATP-binding protein
VIQNQIARSEQFDRAQILLERVGLSAAAGSRRLAEFSGGQRQRLAIARALALDPKLLILDEAFSALDCSVQAQMVNLLVDLQNSTGITCLFITHDLAMAALIADQIAVMDRGRIVESGDASQIVLHPAQKYTRALLAASPRMGQPSAAHNS